MSDSDNRSSQPSGKISVIQKVGMFFLMPAFIVTTGLIIYDKQLADPAVIAVTGFIVFAILLTAIYLSLRKLVTKQYAAYKKLELMAITDELTQLYKRNHFDSVFETELSRAKRYDRHLCCAVIEIDNYKELREKYGDESGDEILQETAESLKDDLRVIDVMARDKNRFLCLLPETDIQPALYVSKRLRSLIEGETIEIEANDEPVSVTISIGITSSNPCKDDHVDIHHIISVAGNALETAKKNGGNKIEHLSLTEAQTAKS